MTWRLEGFTFIRPAPRCTSQRLPHLLRLLLMYQDNPIRASNGENFSDKIVHAPPILHFWPVFLLFALAACWLLSAECLNCNLDYLASSGDFNNSHGALAQPSFSADLRCRLCP